jgi:hypothetical protein
MSGQYRNLTLTPDSKHLLWTHEEQDYAFRVFLDGKPVATGSHAEGTGVTSWWDMGPDGTLSFLAQADNSLQRIRVTPSGDTSVETLLSQGLGKSIAAGGPSIAPATASHGPRPASTAARGAHARDRRCRVVREFRCRSCGSQRQPRLRRSARASRGLRN